MNDTSDKLAQAMFELGELTQEKIAENQQKDPFYQQKIYEKWIKQDNWQLRTEGIPLAIGVDPQEWLAFNSLIGFKQLEETTWQGFVDIAATESSPNLQNPADVSADWKVNSAEFYRWLNGQGITVPDALDSLMQFVMTVVLKPKEQEANFSSTGSISSSESEAREKILGAAFNIVSKEPNACRDNSGLTNGKLLAEMIHAQSVIWFESNKPPMSVEKMGDFLEKWLE